jgi:hypothetical protein
MYNKIMFIRTGSFLSDTSLIKIEVDIQPILFSKKKNIMGMPMVKILIEIITPCLISGGANFGDIA